MASTPTTSAGGSSYNVAYNSSGSHAQEGSFILQNGAYYYLFFSSGICCGTYLLKYTIQPCISMLAFVCK